MLETINVPLEDFVRCFFDGGEKVCLRVFDDCQPGSGRKSGTFKGAKLECEAGKIDGIVDTLRKHNQQNRGVYFVVNHGGHNDNEIIRANAQFVENDSLSIDEQWARLTAFLLPPSLVVRTAKSLHAYWLLKNGDIGKFRNIQKRLVAQFDGDPACVNESRVLRLPGFNHCKGEPVMVTVVKYNPELRYTQSELESVLPQIADSESQKTSGQTPKGARKGLTLAGQRCEFLQYCKANAATLPESLWYAMISNLAVFDGGERAIHQLSKPYPKYSYEETQGKIAHFAQSGTKPMTCAKIAENGFRCPKLESGVCGCKSPAALAWGPCGSDELLEILNNLDKRDTPLENIQVARQFIQDYLYNVDGVTAETLINYDLKSRFDFKANDLRPLLSLHRELYRKYSDSKERKAENGGEGLPDWYEVTDKGGVRFLPSVLADHMAKTISAFYGAGSYYFYDHGVYEQREDLAAFAAVRSLMLKTAKTNEITDAEKQWRSVIRKQVREINANPFIVNVRNGLYNVLDGSFREHSPEYFSTVQIQASYALGGDGRPTAVCPQFLAFLQSVLPESEIPLIQEILGYLLIPVNKSQKSFVFVGAPNAGKSTLLSIAQDVLLGKENVSNIAWQNLNDRFKTAELFGKLANVFADLPSKAVDDGSMFKSLTGEDYITAERKNKDPFNFRPYARLLFSCNDIPKNYTDRSDGFYRRLMIIRFDKSVPQDKRDPNLREKIAAERDGILIWALDGLKRLMANNYLFSETKRTKDELKRYKIESNAALMFLEECCEVGEGCECVRETLFEKYRDFCLANGYKAMSQTNFNKDVEASNDGIERGLEKVSRRKTWKGVRIAT
jgi:putative DNA primase/helicase